ncbi:hypothetical protein [Micromonospora costi]|uniref:Uncharacterized protein n=1 Tax=Micromonospora costi TaxID=1530042 RepID=A0A3B0A672_9ACTN|nr:hypothetical protein [Micromonospora costi]RKN55899.1 hypothetical protein D7193_15015 [Micromonospora costi]
MSAPKRRRVGTKFLPATPAAVQPLELDIDRDHDGDGDGDGDERSAVRDALLDYGPFVALLALLGLAVAWVIQMVVQR